MHTNEKATAYTPQISRQASGALRRIAWLRKEPMTRTLENIVREVARTYNPEDICNACKGRKTRKSQCETCFIMEESVTDFSNNTSPLG